MDCRFLRSVRQGKSAVKKKEPEQYGVARTLQRRDPSWPHRPVDDPASMRQPASQYDASLNVAAVAWLSELPQEVAPLALAKQFPRIVNRLSRFWDSPRMIDEYLRQLLLDRRGKRKGFPQKVLNELYALGEYHRVLHKTDTSDVWDSIPYRKPAGI
jgi:hypothetical protein